MKAKKIVRYRLPVSLKFPATHKRAGELTFFKEKIGIGLGKFLSTAYYCEETNRFSEVNTAKIHTIRANYDLWAKRIEKIQRGEAVLELYYWSGKPYNSKCVTICQLGKEDGVGIQDVRFAFYDLNKPWVAEKPMEILNLSEISKNDGLSLEDFKEWFRGYNLSQPMAIIHFTGFKY